MLDIKTIKELLHKRKLKATNSRIDLLLNLDKFGSAMPYSAIQKGLISIDRVTLYRTLQTLSDKGIIHKAAHVDNEDYYAICEHSCTADEHLHHHVHFKCDDCNTITCELTPLTLFKTELNYNKEVLYLLYTIADKYFSFFNN